MRSARKAAGQLGRPSAIESAARQLSEENPVRPLAWVGMCEISMAYGKVCLFDKALMTNPRRAFVYFDALVDALEEAHKRSKARNIKQGDR